MSEPIFPDGGVVFAMQTGGVRRPRPMPPVLPADWSRRLHQLQALPAGWLDRMGDPVTTEAMRASTSFLRLVSSACFPRPAIYPTIEGGIQIEFTGPLAWLEVHVDPKGRL